MEVVPGGPVCGSIRPPGSKSLTNRALVCAALASERSVLRGALASEDTEVMIDALRKLGMEIDVTDGGSTLAITPTLTRPVDQEIDLYIANSGTTIRFLTAALSAIKGRYRLHGVPRMHQRPIGDLVDALKRLGCQLETESPGGCPPVRIVSQGWIEAETEVAGAVSSQFLSGLLMAAPAAGHDITVKILGELVSRPYVEMTLALMQEFGANISELPGNRFLVDAGFPYVGREYSVEPDASAASYHWACAAITGGSVTVQGLNRSALQGDVAFVDVLEQMGCTVVEEGQTITVSGRASKGLHVDMKAISDCVQTLAVVALFAEGPTTVTGVGHNRFKETDRIGDLATELRKLGAVVDEHDDGLTITPRPLHGAVLDTYHDHRMAMSLSLAGLVVPGVRILDPVCTVKTYPNYFADLERLIQRSHRWAN